MDMQTKELSFNLGWLVDRDFYQLCKNLDIELIKETWYNSDNFVCEISENDFNLLLLVLPYDLSLELND